MSGVRKKTIVLLGLTSKMPVAGNMWLIAQYIIGFRRLGYDVYYIEAHGCKPAGNFIQPDDEFGTRGVCNFLAGFMRRFDMTDRWAYHDIFGDGQLYGLTELQLKELYRSADLIINLHGGTIPLPEHTATRRLVYLETDPVQAELEIHANDQQKIDLLKAHDVFFTWGINYGNPDCGVPLPDWIKFHPTLPPVVIDLWASSEVPPGDAFTTVGNWRQGYKKIKYNGSVYHWSKHHEFLKFIDLPQKTSQAFELALSRSSYNDADKQLLESHGWRIRDGLEISSDLDTYRDYLRGSRGEFTVAKDQNVRLRSGWFSERSAQYLAAGRPVITQETGFGNVLPRDIGLFGFSTMDQILAAANSVNANYQNCSRAASRVAQDFFNYDVVLRSMLERIGL